MTYLSSCFVFGWRNLWILYSVAFPYLRLYFLKRKKEYYVIPAVISTIKVGFIKGEAKLRNSLTDIIPLVKWNDNSNIFLHYWGFRVKIPENMKTENNFPPTFSTFSANQLYRYFCCVSDKQACGIKQRTMLNRISEMHKMFAYLVIVWITFARRLLTLNDLLPSPYQIWWGNETITVTSRFFPITQWCLRRFNNFLLFVDPCFCIFSEKKWKGYLAFVM